jgi:hypothetical protein
MVGCRFRLSHMVIKYSSLQSSFKVRTACPTAEDLVRSLNLIRESSYKQATVVPTSIHYPAAWEQWSHAHHIATEGKRIMSHICLNNRRGTSAKERTKQAVSQFETITLSERIRPSSSCFRSSRNYPPIHILKSYT